jgi:hypothetical protein
MISAQKESLDIARKKREEALKATKVIYFEVNQNVGRD